MEFLANLPVWAWILIVIAVMSAGSGAIRRWDSMVAHRRQLALEKVKAANPSPTCQCEHGLSMHDPATGRCVAQTEKAVRWETQKIRAEDAHTFKLSVRIGTFEDDGEEYALEKVPVEWEAIPCGCLRYVGPEPLITLSAPELAPTAMETGHRIPPSQPAPQIASGGHSPSQGRSRPDPVTYESTFTYDKPERP